MWCGPGRTVPPPGSETADVTRPRLPGTEATTCVSARDHGRPLHVGCDGGKEQRAGQFPEWQVSLVNPDFAEYARLCGAGGRTVRTVAEHEDGVAEMLAADGPYLLHVVQDVELV